MDKIGVNDSRADEGSLSLGEGHSIVSGATYLSREHYLYYEGSS